MRVLVTGGAGFIGQHVVASLIDVGHEVTVLDCLLPSAWRAARPLVDRRARFIEGDVTSPDTVHAALSGIDAVVHHAAMVGMGVDITDQPAFVTHNGLGTAVLLAAMTRRRVQRLVMASSMVVYGEGAYACAMHGSVRPAPRDRADLDAGRFDPRCEACGRSLTSRPVDEDTPPEPRSTYAVTKLAQEHLAAVWQRETGSDVVALRYHNVYGPRMPRDTPYAGVAAIFRSALEAGRPPQVFEDGRQLRDFVHVGDVARANVLALERDLLGQFVAINIASGRTYTVLAMAATLADALDGPAPEVTGRYRSGDVRHVVASPERAAAVLGFTASIDPQDGLRSFATSPLRD